VTLLGLDRLGAALLCRAQCERWMPVGIDSKEATSGAVSAMRAGAKPKPHPDSKN